MRLLRGVAPFVGGLLLFRTQELVHDIQQHHGGKQQEHRHDNEQQEKASKNVHDVLSSLVGLV
jgi:hypothetical protein